MTTGVSASAAASHGRLADVLAGRDLEPAEQPAGRRDDLRDRLPGIGSAADLRASVKLNADRQTYSMEVSPVFSTAGKVVQLPKIPLLPGGEALTCQEGSKSGSP